MILNKRDYRIIGNWIKDNQMLSTHPDGFLRVAFRDTQRILAVRNRYKLACQIRRIRSQTPTERLDCIAAIKAAKQGSFLPLIVDVDERLAATHLCGPKMMANAVEAERLRWVDPLEFRQRSANVGCRPAYCLKLHHREAIASFKLCRRLP